MHNFYNKNIDAIKQYKPKLYESIENYNSRDCKSNDVTAVTIEGNNKSILGVIKDNETIQLDTFFCNDSYMDKWYGNLNNNYLYNSYILLGFGSGMFVRRILKEAKEKDVIFVFEPVASVFIHCLEIYDLSDVVTDKRVWLVLEDMTVFRTVITENMLFSMAHMANKSVYPNYIYLFKENVLEFLDMIEEVETGMQMAINTVYFQAPQKLKNLLINTAIIKYSKSIKDFSSRIDKNTPVIIVASGPSLDKNVELLNEAKGKSIIVCVDSAINALMKRDIIPDFIFSADVNKKRGHFSDERVNHISTIGFCQSVPHAYGDQKNNYVLTNEFDISLSKWHCKTFSINGEGSVANVAFTCFIELGFKNLILIGQDLAFTDGFDHASGIINDKPVGGEKEIFCYIDGIYGTNVKSTNQLRMYVKVFEKDIKKHPEINVIDATEGGAKIGGTQIMTFKQAIEKYCIKKVDIKQIESQTETIMNEEQREKFVQMLDNTVISIDDIKRDFEKSLNIYRNILREAKTKYNVSKIKNLFSQADVIIKRIYENNALDYVEMLNNETNEGIQKKVNILENNERDEIISAVNIAIEFNESMIKSADKAKELFLNNQHVWKEEHV